MKTSKIYYFLILYLFFATKLIYAAPSISSTSGSLSDGGSLIISGSSFGTKTNAAPLIWDTFEDNSVDVNTTALDRDNWDSTSTFTSSSGDKHSGSYSAYSASGGDFRLETSSGDNDKLYITLWRRYTAAMTQDDLNKKFFGLYPNGAPDTPRPVNSWHGSTLGGGTPRGIFIVEPDCYATTGFCVSDLPSTSWMVEEWIIQFSSGLNQADGIFQYLRNGTSKVNKTDIIYRCTDYTTNPGDLRLRNDGTYNGNIYMDDIYVDNTWSHVIIGDASTLGTSSHLEIQIPSAWATGEITVTLNQGSFGALAGNYLFVVDSDGVASSGYLLSSGSSSSVTFSGMTPVGMAYP